MFLVVDVASTSDSVASFREPDRDVDIFYPEDYTRWAASLLGVPSFECCDPGILKSLA